MLRKLLVGAALAGSLGLAAAPAQADHLGCFTITVVIDDQVVEQVVCPGH